MATTLEIILRAQNRLSGELKRVQLELKAIQANLVGVGGAATGAGTKVKVLTTSLAGATAQANALRTTILAFGGIALFVGAVRTIAKFEQSMANVRAIMLTVGDAAENADEKFAALNAEARRLGGTTIFTASQAAEGLLFLGRAGFTAQEALDSLEGTLALAAAGNIGLSQAADIATNVLAGFGLAATEAGRVADVLAFTAASANTDVIQLGDAMKFVAPIAASLGVPVGDAAAAIGILSNAGLKASLAGTGLRKVLVKLAAPTKKLKKVMKGLGIDIDDLNLSGPGGLARAMELLGNTTFGAVEAIDLFGDRGAPAALAMANMSNELKTLTEETHRMRNAALDMAEVMTNTLTGSFKLFTSAIQEAIIATGDSKNGFGQNLKRLVDALAGMVRILNGTQDPMHENAVLFQRLADGARLLGKFILLIIASKFILFIGGVVSSLGTMVVALRAAVIAFNTLGASFLRAGAIALAALGPAGWIIGLGIALVAFATNDAPKAIQALKDFEAELNTVRRSVRLFNAEQLKVVAADAVQNLINIKDEFKNLEEEISKLGSERGGDEVDRIVRDERLKNIKAKRDELQFEINFQEERTAVLKKLASKAAADELAAKEKKEARLAKLEGTAAQAAVSAIIANRKLEEEQNLIGLKSALRIAKQREKEGVAVLKAELDKKIISIETYYSNVKALGNRSLDAEIAIAQAKVDVVKKANATRQDDFESERNAAIKSSESDAELDAITKTFEARQKIVDSKNAEALLVDGEALTKLLEQRSVINAEFDSREAIALQTKLEKDAKEEEAAAKRAFKALKKRFKERLKEIVAQRHLEVAAAERGVVEGALNEISFADTVRSIDQATAERLTKMKEDMQDLNAAATDPNFVLSLQNVTIAIDEMGIVAEERFNAIKLGIADSMVQPMLDFVNGASTAKEAFSSFAQSVLQDIARIYARQLALNIISGFSGGGSVSASPSDAIGTPFKKGGLALATGGFITGNGTSTSDSIPARLSDGEYVVQAKAVRHYGLNFVEALNRMALDNQSGLRKFSVTRPRRASFAGGGIVDSGAGTKEPVPQVSSLRIINVLDSDESIENFMASSSGEAIVINHMRRNSSILRNI